MLVYLFSLFTLEGGFPFLLNKKKDGAQIYNEIKARAKGDIFIVCQKNLIFHIILPQRITSYVYRLISLAWALLLWP